jgi:hypothetical protein
MGIALHSEVASAKNWLALSGRECHYVPEGTANRFGPMRPRSAGGKGPPGQRGSSVAGIARTIHIYA